MSVTVGYRPRLTVAVIVRNAAQELSATLESVRPLADELVVLDLGSTDDTIAVASRHGALTRTASSGDDASSPRNAVLPLARGDWILWLEPGETLPPADARELRSFLERKPPRSAAYRLLVRLPAVAGSSGEEREELRLIPNLQDIRFAGVLTPSVAAALETLGIGCERLPIAVEAALPALALRRGEERARRVVALAEQAMAHEGESARIWNDLGDACLVLGEFERGRAAHERARNLAAPGSRDQLVAYYGLLTAYEGEPDHRSAQLALCLEALEVFPLDSPLLCALGGYLVQLGHLDLARRALQTAYEHGEVQAELWHLSNHRAVAALACADVLVRMQRADEAQQLLADAIREYPGDVRVRRGLIALRAEQGDEDGALAALGGWRDAPDRNAQKIAIRGMQLAAQEDWPAARAQLLRAREEGCNEPWCLARLARVHYLLGEDRAARSVLAELAQLDPRHPEIEPLLRAIDARRQVDRRVRIDRASAADVANLPASSTPTSIPVR